MRKLLCLLLMTALLASQAAAETLTADLASTVCEMSDTLYGLFFEDINHAADGGLYAELLQNRSFENQDLLKPSVHQHLTGWQFNTRAGADGKVQIADDDPLHANNPTYVSITGSAGYAFQNLGYGDSAFRGGICVQKGAAYDASAWLRGADFAGEITVALTNKAGAPLSNTLSFEPAADWQKYDGVLTAEADAIDACLTFALAGEGTIDVDMASLMPQDRVGADWPGGGLRRALVEALAALHPRFLRFPGGCVAEGSYTWDNLYRWKDTVGPVEQRRENWNTWGYMQSYGIGFYEYFCLCEQIGALPLPVVGSGVLCQAREPRENPMDDAALAAWTQDILDLLEFALGGPDTAWGALRCQMGHEAPFDLRYLAIGNENWQDIYFNRYEKIRSAVKERYPQITCIVANGPVADGSLFNASRAAIRKCFATDVADEHYYMDSDWFLRNTHRYDQYPRETRVFLGEYAAHEPAAGGRRPNNLYSALCEAAYLTGIERNSDVVIMCCYAPLMARIGMDQWTPDLIWFDSTQVILTPNYYIQQMFAQTLGDRVVQSALKGNGLYHVVTARQDGTVFIKLVNVTGQEKQIALDIPLLGNAQGVMTMLSGEKQTVNSRNHPQAIRPTQQQITWTDGQSLAALPGFSAVVIEARPETAP